MAKLKVKPRKPRPLPPAPATGYLFLVVDGDYYALTKRLVKQNAYKIPKDGKDVPSLLKELVDDGVVLADIQGPNDGGVRPDSCACVALNIDKFDARISEKQQAILAKMASTSKRVAKKALRKSR